MAEYCNGFIFEDLPPEEFEFQNDEDNFASYQGLAGPYYTPFVDEDGNISWTNNGQLPNPATQNIRGPQGKGIQISGVAADVEDLPAVADQGEVWAVGSDSDYDGYVYLGGWVNLGPILQAGPQGPQGVTFTPSVSSEGVISWTNDGELPNPESVNIKGPPGEDGEDGEPGEDGDSGATFTPSVDPNGNISWTNDKDLPNPQTVNIKGPQGEGVPPGGTAGQILRKTANGTEWHSPDAGDAAYDGTGTYSAGTVGAGIKENAASIASLIQESAFEIEVEDGEYVLYFNYSTT